MADIDDLTAQEQERDGNISTAFAVLREALDTAAGALGSADWLRGQHDIPARVVDRVSSELDDVTAFVNGIALDLVRELGRELGRVMVGSADMNVPSAALVENADTVASSARFALQYVDQRIKALYTLAGKN